MHYKYPRTPHLPWSPGATTDDIRSPEIDHFVGKDIVVTEKMDGENTTLYRDFMHARSLDSRYHLSRAPVKNLHAKIAHLIPEGWRLCGENLYARHSISYDQLAGYFYLFSIWTEKNECLSWDDTKEWADTFELPTPLEYYRGTWDMQRLKALQVDTAKTEGYVIRNTAPFSYDRFSENVGKWVRANHVTTDAHWRFSELVPNKLYSG